MISFKKSYAEQLFQLALALSLLRVDPDSYLGYGWESQLASLHDGGDVGWQLELRAAPLTDYPYANRKALMPIIEDLARFRETSNPYDVTAYLLNVQNGGLQQETTNEAPPSPAPPNTSQPDIINDQRNTTNSNEYLTDPDLLDIYSDELPDSDSILTQTLADLNDYGEMPFSSFNIINYPMKDEPPEIPLSLYEERRQRERASTSFSSGFESIGSPQSNFSASAVIDWQEYFNATKTESEEDDLIEVASNTTSSVDKIKVEILSENDIKDEKLLNDDELSEEVS